MITCHDMKMDEIYYCTDCGLELKVVKTCNHQGCEEDDCDCCSDGENCAIFCCGKPLQKKG